MAQFYAENSRGSTFRQLDIGENRSLTDDRRTLQPWRPTATAESAISKLISGPPYRTILKLAIPYGRGVTLAERRERIDVFFFSKLPHLEDSNGQRSLPSLLHSWLFGGSLSAISVGTWKRSPRGATRRRNYERARRRPVQRLVLLSPRGLRVHARRFRHRRFAARLILKGPAGASTSRAPNTAVAPLGIISMSGTMALRRSSTASAKTWVHLVSAVAMNICNVVMCWLASSAVPDRSASRAWAHRRRLRPRSSRRGSAFSS